MLSPATWMVESRSESRSVARRAGLVTVGTLASRLLGMVREAVIAASFEVAATDVFWLAYTIPNTLRMLLGEGAVTNAFIPVFTDLERRKGRGAAQAFLAYFAGALLALLLLACVVGILAAPLLGLFYAGGLAHDAERFALLVSLIRSLFPFLALTGAAALATGALNVLGHYLLPAFAPALFNVAMIGAPLLLLPWCAALGLTPIYSLVLGALIGGLGQLAIQLWPLMRLGMLPVPRLRTADRDVRRALGLMGPMVLGLGVYQLNMLLSRLFASFLPVGSPSYLNYGMRVVEVPQGMFALAVASAALPAFAKLRSEGKHAELRKLFQDALSLTLFVALPASALLWTLAEPTVAVLLGRGAFGPTHLYQTGRSLAVQALGVLPFACVRAVVPMFAAHEDTRTPVRASTVNLLVFVVVSAAFLPLLDHVAIALGNTLAALAQLGLLLVCLRKHTGPLGLRTLLRRVARSAFAALVMAVVLGGLAPWFPWQHPPSESARALAYVAVCSAGALVYVLVAHLLGVEELREIERTLRRRFRRLP